MDRIVAYELKLLEVLKIYKVFHVGLLRKYVYDPNHTLPDLPKTAYVRDFLADFEKILKLKNQYLKNEILYRFYVKWKNYPEEK